MSYITHEAYSAQRERPKLLRNYLDQMVKFLSLKHPNTPLEVITAFVEQTIRERYKTPKIEALVHKREGCRETVKMGLDAYIQTHIKDNNLAPSGTCYMPVSRKESFLRISIDDKVKARSKYKKLGFSYAAKGMKREAQYYNYQQANAKIFNNAIAGGMKITQFILGCKAGFNSITSVGRMCVKQGYSLIERMVNGNIYIPSINDATTYIVNHVNAIHAQFPILITSGVLYTPSVDDVLEYLVRNVKNYQIIQDTVSLRGIIENLTDVERAYVFYVGCLNNLFRFNDHIMRTWINSCFVPEGGFDDPSVYAAIDLKDIKNYPDDVVNAILSTNFKLLGKHPTKKDTWNGIKDAEEHNPEGLRRFIYCCQVFTEQFTSMLPILLPILQIETTFNKLIFQHKMARRTVPLSDTDSNIFSTQELIRWKRGKIDFSQESYEMNALTTYIVTQSLEHVFATLSAGFGIEGKDVFRISMKNEFLYPILVVTSLAKHYLAIATMQEGALLATPRKDIKGVGFRSSTYPKQITQGFEAFIVDLFAKIEEASQIRAGDILQHVDTIERTIHRSISALESDYLQTVTIKRKEEYANPAVSQYFYYELWKDVFSEEYGEMVIPNKCYKIPLKGGKKFFKNVELMTKIQAEHPQIYDRLMEFKKNNPDRDISAILIPPFKGKIHPFFLEIMDIRSHISQVLAGYYHFLDALGLGTVDTRANGLVSDFFNPAIMAIE